jgi:hypothetical protein
VLRRLYPTLSQHALIEHENSTIDGQTIDLASSPHQPYDSDVIIPSSLSPTSRDSIFKLVTSMAQAHISIPSFPDADCLDKLIKVGIAKRTETDAWLHPYTFDSNNTTPELLTALVSAGCVCFGIPAVNRTGLTLQEISRLALSKLVSRLLLQSSFSFEMTDCFHRPKRMTVLHKACSIYRPVCYGLISEPSADTSEEC